MNKADLAKYLPKYGDQLPIKNFERIHFTDENNSETKEVRKRNLVTRLKEELTRKAREDK